MTALPRLLKLTARRATLGLGEKSRALGVGQTVGGWTLKAIVDDFECALLENDRDLMFLGLDGTARRLARPDLRAELLAAPAHDTPWYDGLLAALNDPLAEAVLAGGEASFDAVRAVLPPLVDYAFLGDMQTTDRVMLLPDGSTLRDLEGKRLPGVGADPGAPAVTGLLDGCLPVIVQRWEGADGWREQLSFGVVCGGGSGLTVFQRLTDAAGEKLLEDGAETEPERFYRWLWRVVEEHDAYFAPGLDLSLPEPELAAAARAMLNWGRLTFRGRLPRYGVGTYDEPQHNSFPPAVIFLTQALLTWGLVDEGAATLGFYLDRYGREDGTVDYYGPAVAEYGQILVLVAEITRLVGPEWLEPRLVLVRAMWERLVRLQQASADKYPPGDPRHGLIPGLPEADYHHLPDEWDQFYYAGDAWVSRGLHELGAALMALEDSLLPLSGLEPSLAGLRHSLCLLESLVSLQSVDPAYVPPGPAQLDPITCLTRDTHASYCNYRYLPEMAGGGVAPREVLQWRRKHGGELLAMTRFGQQLDDWPALHQARAMLETDDTDHYLLLMYAHWAHHCAQGHWTSYEQVAIRPDAHGFRRVIAGQVVPCQVMVPTMLRWALVFEDAKEDVLWLCRAMPRRWLGVGEKVAIKRVPTRYGTVGFTLRRRSAQAGEMVLELPKEGLEARLKIRLRAPLGDKVRTVTVGEKRLKLSEETITLPAGLAGRVKLQLGW